MNVRTDHLNPLQSKSIKFSFYFPTSGTFKIYPATVIKDSEILCTADIAATITVKDEKTVKEMNTMKDIIAEGNLEDILTFLKSKNLLNTNIFNFRDIYWLLSDKNVFE